ncbi:ADP-ribose glycohydrolase OARD1 [Rhagoletis pomonella]|uniref:ADP-ribose glycohydrolase OARD1 n=1 Tax=Rhagoletis pomonella TaxID=28610 RepID=UPI0017808E2C|nr:ADP-ribose glycohydrolase OARD1 [Rhagoletis pomonella]XP_036335618.1 ADP-ribose glycohydrolase OARD1 [Rhagoletis pomonella]
MSTCQIKEITGDLFSADEKYCMAHCVAADMRLGKGIAVKFRNKFGQIPKLKQQNVKPGGVAILQDKSRFIYYLVTKQSSWGKPTYQTLHDSLDAMKRHMLEHGVNNLAIPRIGCGLDGLVWPKVKDLLKEVFKEVSIEIVVYNYVP